MEEQDWELSSKIYCIHYGILVVRECLVMFHFSLHSMGSSVSFQSSRGSRIEFLPDIRYVGGNLSHDDVNQKHFVLRLHVGVAGPDSELARCREEKMLCKDNTGQGMDGLVDMPPTLGLSQQTPALFHYSTLPLS
jgi:hypothetical protein